MNNFNQILINKDRILSVYCLFFILTFVLRKMGRTKINYTHYTKLKDMNKNLLILLLLTGTSLLAQNGTAPDATQVIVGSQVERRINVIANDILNVNRTYKLVGVYYSVTSPSPNITAGQVNGTTISYRDNQSGATNNDTVFYIAEDQNGQRDTNYLVVTKANLPLDQYAGDCNRDNICNNIDVLSIGLGYNLSDQAREGIYQSSNWGPVRAYNWANGTLVNNHRYADADGNGIIDSTSDISVVVKNYNLTANGPNVVYSPTGGPVFGISSPDTFSFVGTSPTFSFKVDLGSATLPATSAGLAFTLLFDAQIFKPNLIRFIPNKWYADQHNTLNFSHVNASSGELDLTIVRKDRRNNAGSGELGVIEIVVDDVMGGIAAGINTKFEIIKAVLIDSAYLRLPVTLATPKTVHVVKKLSSGLQNTLDRKLSVGQDDQKIYLSTSLSKKPEVKIYNILGGLVYQSKDWTQGNLSIPTVEWPKGIYLIQSAGDTIKIQR